MENLLKAVLTGLFGKDVKVTLIGYVTAIAVASVAYFGAHSEPGWYLVALGFGALGRYAAQESKKSLPPGP